VVLPRWERLASGNSVSLFRSRSEPNFPFLEMEDGQWVGRKKEKQYLMEE
jgi:hypothetical protein